MGMREKFEQWLPPSEQPAHYLIGEECGDISPDVWREAPLPEDPEEREQRIWLKHAIFDVFFGTEEERRLYGQKCFPFTELPHEAVESMPPALRESYEAELAMAMDPRSGRIVRPYLPSDIAPEV